MTTKNFVVKNGLTTGSITLDASSGNISGANASLTGNLSVTGKSNLGAVGNVTITGGSSGYILQTDGAGNLSFSDPVATQSPAPMPTYIAAGNTVTISANYQGIFGYPITVDGTIVVDGILVDVNDATVPAGNLNYVQYNNGNVMGGDANFYYTAVNGTMTVQNSSVIGNSTIGNLTTSYNANLGSVSNVKITGGINGYYLQTDGTGNLSWAAGGGGGAGSPGGTNTQVQFNDAGTFGGNSSFTFNKTTGVLNVTGNITSTTVSASGNVTGAYLLGNGSQLTGITATNATTAGTVTTNAQPNITSTGTLSSLSVSGNANVGNLNTAGQLVSTLADGTAPMVITSTTKVANLNVEQVDGFHASQSTIANTIVVRDVNGNISTNNFTATGLITATGNLTAGNLVTAGQLISTIASGTAPFVVVSNTLVPNLSVAQAQSASTAGTAVTVSGASQGNITSVGTLTSLNVSGNANAGNIGTSGLITATGNIQGGNLIAGSVVTAIGSIQGGNLFTVGQLSAGGVANVGSLTTNSTISAAGNANVGNLGVAGLITATGNLTAANITTGGAVSATGNVNAYRLYVSFADSTGVITAPQFTSNIATGTSPFVVASTTRVSNLNVTSAGTADIAGSVTTNAQPNITSTGTLVSLSVTGNIISGNVYANSGTIGASSGTFTTVAGNLTTAAQPNITSTGTLTSVTVSGNITAQANINMTGYVIRSVGTGISAAGSTQGTATAIAKEINVVSTVATSSGVILPTAVAGMAITITNTSANSLLVYPATGAQINTLGTNVGYTQASGATLQFVAPTSTQWYSVGASYA